MRSHHVFLCIALGLLFGSAYLYFSKPTPALRSESPARSERSPRPSITPPVPPSAAQGRAPTPAVPHLSPSPRPIDRPTKADAANDRPTLHYRVDDGVAVVQGDVAVGVPVDPSATAGVVQLMPLKTWGREPIAYYIQPGVENPDRVHQALRLFANTQVRFVELTTQTDALVFEPTAGVCKSYLGRVGGRQPVWIAPGCGPTEIAHEIMHALGFAHEQNRADRDAYITVNIDGIEDEFKYNFDKLPPAYTRLSQAAPFDFTSIMMYPPWMFAKGGQSTMAPKDPDQRIAPGTRLSPADERRIDASGG